MKLLKDHEDFLDKVALEVALTYVKMKPPHSPSDNVKIATISYKQALAMLEVKMRLEAVLEDTPFLVGERVKNKKEKND